MGCYYARASGRKCAKTGRPRRSTSVNALVWVVSHLPCGLPVLTLESFCIRLPFGVLSCAVPQLVNRRYDRISTGTRSQFYCPDNRMTTGTHIPGYPLPFPTYEDDMQTIYRIGCPPIACGLFYCMVFDDF